MSTVTLRRAAKPRLEGRRPVRCHLHACGGALADHPSRPAEPVIGLAEGRTRWLAPQDDGTGSPMSLMHSFAPSPPNAVPARPIAFAKPSVIRELRPDGAVVLRAAAPLEPYDPSLARLFRAAVEIAPGRIFLAERAQAGANDWRTLTYEQ